MNLLMDEEKLTKLSKIFFGISVSVSIIGYFFLPSTMAVQFDLNGVSNTMPKELYLLIINGISGVLVFAKKGRVAAGTSLLLLILNLGGIIFNILA